MTFVSPKMFVMLNCWNMSVMFKIAEECNRSLLGCDDYWTIEFKCMHFISKSFLHFYLFFTVDVWILSCLPHNSLTSHECFGMLCMLGHLPVCPEMHSLLNIWMHVNTQMLCQPDNPRVLWVLILHKGNELLQWQEFCRLSQCSL